MRLNSLCLGLIGISILSGCMSKKTNPIDPYEPFNRKIYRFNDVFDKALLKPVAGFYQFALPGVVRKSISNAFNNLDLLPTLANDVLQAEGKWAIKDAWRLIINSSIGIGGLFDPANSFGLPPHYTDLGITFAKWGDKKSPYIMIPFIGPSTIRDGCGWLFQFVLWSPYVYISEDALAYGLVGLRYIDLRAQLLDSEQLMNEALDPYAFIRDAYLQHRAFLIQGTEVDDGSLYIKDEGADKVALENNSKPSDYEEE